MEIGQKYKIKKEFIQDNGIWKVFEIYYDIDIERFLSHGNAYYKKNEFTLKRIVNLNSIKYYLFSYIDTEDMEVCLPLNIEGMERIGNKMTNIKKRLFEEHNDK